MEEKHHCIRLEKNGPIRKINLPLLEMQHGEDIPLVSDMSLCRCGKSSSQPWCDGSHSRIGFSDEKKPDREKLKWYHYYGKDITVIYNHGICAHVSDCIIGLMEVFNRRRQPWVEPDAAPVEDVIRVIRTCPTGALRYELRGETFFDWNEKPSIKVLFNGPLVVKGAIPLEDDRDSLSELPTPDHYCLCRCGQSKNLPFCDGAHTKGEFFE